MILKNLFFTILIILNFNMLFSQDTNMIINPKNNWYLGLELGLNGIQSYNFDENKRSFQFGFTSEYYFSKNWSFNARLKYFKTGLSFKNSGYNVFNGAVISIPLNIKWEFKIYKNLRINFMAGFVFNQEIKSKYNYPSKPEANYSNFYVNLNSGFGFNYFLNKNTAIFLNHEIYVLGNDRQDSGWEGLKIVPVTPNNNLLNIGIKYNFKN